MTASDVIPPFVKVAGGECNEKADAPMNCGTARYGPDLIALSPADMSPGVLMAEVFGPVALGIRFG